MKDIDDALHVQCLDALNKDDIVGQTGRLILSSEETPMAVFSSDGGKTVTMRPLRIDQDHAGRILLRTADGEYVFRELTTPAPPDEES
jgi:hypothetical protein